MIKMHLKKLVIIIPFFLLLNIARTEAVIEPKLNKTVNNKPLILYDEAITVTGLELLSKLGAQPRYILIYQDNCDPDAKKTGVINYNKIAEFIIKNYGAEPEGWGVLDFEDPFDGWIFKGPSSPECQKAVLTMVSTLREIKKMFPKVKWTYYGVPNLLYYLDGFNWNTASESLKNQEIQQRLLSYGPIMDECEWLSPCIYTNVGDGKGGIYPLPAQRIATRKWCEEHVKMCSDYNKSKSKKIPIIPFASPLYMEGGGARTGSVIPTIVMTEDALVPAFNGGADGITIWTAGSYQITSVLNAAKNLNLKPDDKNNKDSRTVLKHWLEDLNISIEFITSPEGKIRLQTMLADAVVRMAAETIKVWNSKNTSTNDRAP